MRNDARNRFMRTMERRLRVARWKTRLQRRLFGLDRSFAAAVFEKAFRSDAEAVSYFYARHNDHLPDLTDPKRLNEKIRWQFVHHPNPLMRLCADKFAVRDYLSYKGASIAAPKVYAILDDPAGLLSAELPERFVMKPTFSSGRMHVEDGSDPTPRAALVALAAQWTNAEHWPRYGELHYRGLPKRWLVEELLSSSFRRLEYKIFCFMGRPEFVEVITRREGTVLTHALYDPDWRRVPFEQEGTISDPRDIPRPAMLHLLLAQAQLLSEDFMHVRVDFLHFDDRVAFSELTFADMAAVGHYVPDSVDFDLGALIDLTQADRYLERGKAVVRAIEGGGPSAARSDSRAWRGDDLPFPLPAAAAAN